MAEEYHNQSGICSGNWWNSAPNDVVGISYGSSSWANTTTTTTTTTDHHHLHHNHMSARNISSDESANSSVVSGSSSNINVYHHHQDAQKQQESDSVGEGGGGSSSSSILIDSTLQMMGFNLSSSSSSPSLDWNQNFISNNNHSSSGRADDQLLLKDWSLKNFSGGGGGGGGGGENSSINGFKQINHIHGFALDDHQQHPLNSGDGSSECTAITCEGLPTSFPMDSTLYGCPSTLLQGLFEPDDHHLQPQHTTTASYDNSTMNCHPSLTNYFMSNSNDLSSSTTTWPKFPHQYLKSTTSPPKQQSNNNNNNNQSLQFSNDAHFWNASAAAMANGRSSFFPSQQIQFLTSNFEEKPNCSNHTLKPKAEQVRDSSSVGKKSSSEPAFKRPRIESPLPTFKVRKEKLGDRITALQQLVSPFGKTDTASVLFEAIEYIKFLHDQVSVLSAPYLKNGAHMQHHQQNSNKTKEAQGIQQDLRSRGLCLVPISSTFPVTNETATDFWTPTFGGTYR